MKITGSLAEHQQGLDQLGAVLLEGRLNFGCHLVGRAPASAADGHLRATSRREDVLDTVIQLRRPNDYEPEDGARFEVHFTKHRGFAGEDAAPIEAKLTTDGLGRARWELMNLGDKLTEEIRELNADGLSMREIAKRLGVTRGKVTRRLNR